MLNLQIIFDIAFSKYPISKKNFLDASLTIFLAIY